MSDIEKMNTERNAINQARRCQRNWDFSKTIDEDHINHWAYLASHAPSKQDESFFDLYIVTDREKIDFLCKDHSWGFTMYPGEKDWVARNPQMGANCLFVFNRKVDETEVRNVRKDGTIRDPNEASRWDNAYTSIGIASGTVAFSANMMGYVTGYGKNFGYIEEPRSGDLDQANYSQDAWGEVLGIKQEDNNLTYSLGIGHPNDSLKWYESKDNNEYLTGGPIDYSIKKIDSTDPSVNTNNDVLYSQFSTGTRDIKVVRV